MHQHVFFRFASALWRGRATGGNTCDNTGGNNAARNRLSELSPFHHGHLKATYIGAISVSILR
jgi:hypothetical protein